LENLNRKLVGFTHEPIDFESNMWRWVFLMAIYQLNSLENSHIYFYQLHQKPSEPRTLEFVGPKNESISSFIS
jgi:hypothetical protein